MTSYFEIGGEIVEVDTIDNPLDVSMVPEHVLEASMRLHEREQIAYELSGDPNQLHVRSDRERAMELGRVPGRARRARMAFTIAGTLALADGPLPIGDAIAIGFLVAYGSYEVYKSVETLADM
jgi:acyl dehydratase